MRTTIISGRTVEFYLFPFIYFSIYFQVQLQTNYNLVLRSFFYVSGTLKFKTDRNFHLWQFRPNVYRKWPFFLFSVYSHFSNIRCFAVPCIRRLFIWSRVALFRIYFEHMFLALWILALNWPFCLAIASKKSSLLLSYRHAQNQVHKHCMTSFLYERLSLKTKESDSLQRSEKVGNFTTADSYLNSVLW